MATNAQQEEVRLARAMVAGDKDAFARFAEVFRAKMVRYSMLMCGHREDGEEVAQEALMKAFEKIDQLREPERVRPWFFQIAKNACLMMRRKSIFAPDYEVSLDDRGDTGDMLPPEVSDPLALPDEAAIQSQLWAAVERAIPHLPPAYRAVLLLRDLEELSTEETAGILEVSVDVVKTRLHRARTALRKLVDQELGQGSPTVS